MKIFDEIKYYNKEYVYDSYTRIVPNFKKYDSITKTKMLEQIYKKYEDDHFLLSLCTERELKYLEKILNKEVAIDSKKYEWEKSILSSKFLICYSFDKGYVIPKEIEDSVKKALKHVDWKEVRKADHINEVMVAYAKIQGTGLVSTLIQFASSLLEMSEETVFLHMIHNALFQYYVSPATFEEPEDEEYKDIFVYQDYYHLVDELYEQRKMHGLAATINIDLEEFKTLFYNEFNIKNKTIKKFLDELDALPFYSSNLYMPIREFALLHIERDELKENIASIPVLKCTDLSTFFSLLDEAMDEMRSGALNGLTPNEAKEYFIKQNEYEKKKLSSYEKQEDACLSKKDADLFYKLYFGLLDYTNQKYKIKKNFKIYREQGINPTNLFDIIEKFWDEKEELVRSFILENPFQFNSMELEMVSEFKRGIRDMYFIYRFEKEYTVFLGDDRSYMVKGIRSDIDEVISINDLPYLVKTTLIPFKGKIIYDSILLSAGLNLGLEMKKTLDESYNNFMKYYHF